MIQSDLFMIDVMEARRKDREEELKRRPLFIRRESHLGLISRVRLVLGRIMVERGLALQRS